MEGRKNLVSNFFIRVDSSANIGTGHVYRCLSLGEYLCEIGFNVVFISRLFKGTLQKTIQKRGFSFCGLPEDLTELEVEGMSLMGSHKPDNLVYSEWLNASQRADALSTINALQSMGVKESDWLLVDHYALDRTWETLVKDRLGCKLAVIDGQANREHCSDVLIDPTLTEDYVSKWVTLIPSTTKIFTGWEYIPIHPSFVLANNLAKIRKKITNVLISFGGVDQDDMTAYSLQALLKLRLDNIFFTVVLGQNYPYLERLTEFAALHANVHLIVNTEEMSNLMLKADLAIGAGGTMAWERCTVYLPSLVVIQAKNQEKQVKTLDAARLIVSLGEGMDGLQDNLLVSFNALITSPQRLTMLSENARNFLCNSNFNHWQNVFNPINN